MVNTKLGIVPETLWDSNFAGTTKDAKKELLALNIYDEDIFDTPKPEQLLYRIIQIATNKDDLILDCFWALELRLRLHINWEEIISE